MNKARNKEFINALKRHFLSKIEVPRIRTGSKQEIEALINEEALLFAKYLRNEKPSRNPRSVVLK